jgi:hypothetical protein
MDVGSEEALILGTGAAAKTGGEVHENVGGPAFAEGVAFEAHAPGAGQLRQHVIPCQPCRVVAHRVHLTGARRGDIAQLHGSGDRHHLDIPVLALGAAQVEL